MAARAAAEAALEASTSRLPQRILVRLHTGTATDAEEA
jgi:hypothetical protein